MPIVNQGNAQSLSLPAGMVLTVVADTGASGSIVRLADSAGLDPQSVVPILTGQTRTFGPYPNTTRHSVNSDAFNLTYSIGAPTTSGTGRITAKSSTTILGDSILNYGANSTDGYNSNSDILWCNDRLSQFGSQLDVVSFLAGPSKTLALVNTEQLPIALIDGTDIARLHVGVNDFNASIGNLTIANMIISYTSIISQLAAVKKLVIVDSINPVLQAGSTGAKGRAFSFPILNSALHELCNALNETFKNIVFNDSYSAMVDTASATLDPLSGYIRSDDGIHLQSLGAQAAGYALAKTLLSRVSLTPYRSVGPNLLSAFSGTGGTVTNGSGSITGTPPVGWNCAVASGSAAVTITSLAPDMIRFAIANGGGTASTTFIQASNNTALTAASPIGSTIQAGCGFQASGITGLTRINMDTQINNTTNWSGGGASPNEPTIIYPTNAFGGYRKCPPRTQLTTPTNIGFIIAVNVAAGGQVNLDLFNPQFNVLS